MDGEEDAAGPLPEDDLPLHLTLAGELLSLLRAKQAVSHVLTWLESRGVEELLERGPEGVLEVGVGGCWRGG